MVHRTDVLSLRQVATRRGDAWVGAASNLSSLAIVPRKKWVLLRPLSLFTSSLPSLLLLFISWSPPHSTCLRTLHLWLFCRLFTFFHDLIELHRYKNSCKLGSEALHDFQASSPDRFWCNLNKEIYAANCVQEPFFYVRM